MKRDELIKNYFSLEGSESFCLSKDKRAQAVKKALSQALGDFNFRTLSSKEKNGVKVLDSEKNDKNKKVSDFLIEKLENKSFVQEFIQYFDDPEKNQVEFNTWHEKRCEEFLSIIKTYYKDVEYGKAQKIINMMFKYLYCMNWKDVDYENYFKYCHMALDSYILDWFNNQKIGEKITTSWSSLNKEKYVEIQNSIYEKLEKGHDYTKYQFGKKRTKSKEDVVRLDEMPIKAEFVIWFCEMNYAKVRAMCECLEKLSNNSSYYDALLTSKDKEKIEDIINTFSN